MANVAVQQPDGRFAIFSTVSDSFIRLSLTEDEAIAAYGELGDSRPIAELKLKAGIEDRDFVEFGRKGSGLDRWKYCTDTIRQCQGEHALNRVLELIQS
ncbi:hypothetical protein ACYSUW_13225 [Pseudomonas frederiksbergensis]